VNGVRDGKWIINKDNGTLEREEIYKNGVLLNPVPEKEERIDESTIQQGPDKK
jgi:antitoxin component YwqK of YwqJK toxin-antitoxin module